jgi:pimeloyl-ACP methyl ester carboxylesterase
MPTTAANGIEIHYEVHGEGTPLVLAHGYTASLEMWRQQVQPLSAMHRLVIYDLRGHGATTAPADMERYDLARDYVADQVALMDHLGIERAIVGGLSMGGMIAQEFALQHPGRVRTLLLFDTGPGMGGVARDPAVAARFDQMRSMMQALARTKGMGAIVEAIRNRPDAFRPPAGAPIPAGIRAHVENMAKMSVDGYLGGGKALHEWRGSIDRLREITAQTLVLVGAQDPLLAASRLIHEHITGSRLAVLAHSGHGTNLWRPDAFTRTTLDFLADVAAGREVAGEYIVA